MRLMHLTDWTMGVTRFWNLDTNALHDFVALSMMPKVEGSSAHLRGMELEWGGKPKDKLIETGAFVERTPQLTSRLIEYHHNRNGWWYDWPHHPTDTGGEITREEARLVLQRQLDTYPHGYESVVVTGVDRRLCWYFSDGSYQTQYWFDKLVTPPAHNPFTEKGKVRLSYVRGPTLEQVRHFRGELPDYTGPKIASSDLENFGRRPLLYHGPAWACRVEIDGQDVLFDMNRMFCELVRNADGEFEFKFIGTDWCQRDGVERYQHGIDLQKGLYTPQTWLFTVCTKRAQDARKFTPTNVVTKTVQIKRLKAAGVKDVVVPTHAEVMAKHTSAVRVLYEDGKSIEEILTILRDRLAQMAACPETKTAGPTMVDLAKALHKVPVCLGELQPQGEEEGKPYKDETRARYANTTIDGHAYHAPWLTLRGYTGGADEVGQVRPVYLVIDEARVRAMLPTPTVATVSSEPTLPPLTADAIAEIEAMVRDTLAVSGYPVPKWTPDVERKEAGTGCSGMCAACDCKVEDGQAAEGYKCYRPEDDECFFRQQRVAVPESAREYGDDRDAELYASTAEGVAAEEAVLVDQHAPNQQ